MEAVIEKINEDIKFSKKTITHNLAEKTIIIEKILSLQKEEIKLDIENIKYESSIKQSEYILNLMNLRKEEMLKNIKAI